MNLWKFIDSASARLPDAEFPKGFLYHYTDAHGLIGILETGQLWASDVRCLNDTGELQHGLAVIRKAAEDYVDHERYDVFENALNHKTIKYSPVFAVSFSERGDLLSQWRAYAADGAGYSIGFHADSLAGLVPIEWLGSLPAQIHKVVYSPREQQRIARGLVKDAFEFLELPRAPGLPTTTLVRFVSKMFVMTFITFAAMCKSAAFKEEAEWRVVASYVPPKRKGRGPLLTLPKSSFRVGRFGVTPYLSLPFETKDAVREVIAGPKLGVDSQDILLALLSNSTLENWQRVRRRHSQATYRAGA